MENQLRLNSKGIYRDVYYDRINKEDSAMMKAKVFENGRSQAVRLPKECRFEDKEVLVAKIGEVVLLLPKGEQWSTLKMSLDMFSPDFMDDYLKEKGLEK